MVLVVGKLFSSAELGTRSAERELALCGGWLGFFAVAFEQMAQAHAGRRKQRQTQEQVEEWADHADSVVRGERSTLLPDLRKNKDKHWARHASLPGQV
jgi:hypothetical protein